MFTSLAKTAVALFSWLGCMYGVLQIGYLQTGWDHVVCGPWGCGPTGPALAAYHLFWLTLILPPAAMVASLLPERLRSKIGLGFMALAGCAALTIVAWQAAVWLPKIHPGQNAYFVQRCLFVIATLIDIPMTQVFLAGMLFWTWPRASRSSSFADPAKKKAPAGISTPAAPAPTDSP